MSDSIRLDIWLDVACLFKTRSEAKRACEGGKIDVNGDHAKPNRLVREGDRVRISRGAGRVQDVIVRIILEQHVRKTEARALYDDVTPKPSAEEIERRRQERAYRAAAAAAGTPDRRRRREIRRFKEGE
ncbi:MAG: RNA-binding S4 domain-containing protein [Vicinamibacterales bacterium]